MSHYRKALTSSDNQQDDQLLETDIMRFMAIIGIVFWIIFSLVRMLPEQENMVEEAKIKPVLETVDKSIDESTAREKAKEQMPVVDATVSVKLANRPGVLEDNSQKNKIAAATAGGLYLQFASRASLQQLLEKGRVKLFARAGSEGFELLFAARLNQGKIVFTGERILPDALWKISSGRDHDYFLESLEEKFPVIIFFPEKEIFVSFVDDELEKKMDETFFRLKLERKNGVLSVFGSGQIVFRPAPDPEMSEKGAS